MSLSDGILRGCNHEPETGSRHIEVSLGAGETVKVCFACLLASTDARKAERKAELAAYWSEYRERQTCAMVEAGAYVGQRVAYFAASMLGPAFGGLTLWGTIRRNRNGIAVVKLDAKYNGKQSAPWNRGWKPTKNDPQLVADVIAADALLRQGAQS